MEREITMSHHWPWIKRILVFLALAGLVVYLGACAVTYAPTTVSMESAEEDGPGDNWVDREEGRGITAEATADFDTEVDADAGGVTTGQ